MKVLMTCPRFADDEDISGTKTMIDSIIENGGGDFVRFRADQGGIANLLLPYACFRAVRASRPDIVHLNTSLELWPIVRDVALETASSSRPIVLHIHDGHFPTGFGATLAGRLIGQASHVIVTSDAKAAELENRMPNVKFSVLPNAVAVAKFHDPDRERSGLKNVVYVDRLDRSKDTTDMIEACRMLSAQGFKFRLSCYSKGPRAGEFVASMTKVLGENFYSGGVLRGEEKLRALQDADILLMPSTVEGLPLALLEAMAAGCVPVVSNRGSMPSVIKDGRNGFVVEPGDLTQIVGRIKFLLSEGETGWRDLRANAHRTVRERFDLADYTDKLKKIYSEVKIDNP